MRRFGVEVEFYPVGSSDGSVNSVASLLRKNTRLVWCESPGSITMEVQDIPAIAKVVHHAGALVIMDNTWSAGLHFDAFAHGVDISVQALTKYVGGHSDILLGSITMRDEAAYGRIASTHQIVGAVPSPDDCSLALRGMKTLAVRLKTVEESALALARWLAQRPEIELVLHPALPSCPGHEFWKRDFTGSAGLFSVVFRKEFTRAQVHHFIDKLELFAIGYSWAGVASLLMTYDLEGASGRPDYGSRLVRLNIGLEDVEDLQRDLEQALEGLG